MVYGGGMFKFWIFVFGIFLLMVYGGGMFKFWIFDFLGFLLMVYGSGMFKFEIFDFLGFLSDIQIWFSVFLSIWAIYESNLMYF